MEIANQLKVITGSALLLLSLNTADSQEMAHAVLKNQQGKDVGHVELTATKSGVQLRLMLKGMPPGQRAFHIHEVGRCEPPFTSAGGHFNPEKKKHGKAGSGHAGDMPNLNIPKNGELKTEVVNAAITLEKGKSNSVFHSGGTAVVIHAGPDDYKTDPAGNAGDRIACGVIAPGGSSAVAPPKK
jgi:Cu-Zn family superoxide dismutase